MRGCSAVAWLSGAFGDPGRIAAESGAWALQIGLYRPIGVPFAPLSEGATLSRTLDHQKRRRAARVAPWKPAKTCHAGRLFPHPADLFYRVTAPDRIGPLAGSDPPFYCGAK